METSYSEIIEKLLPIEKGLFQFKSFTCNKVDHQKLKNGGSIKNIYDYTLTPSDVSLAFFNETPVCILVCDGSFLRPKRKFNLIY